MMYAIVNDKTALLYFDLEAQKTVSPCLRVAMAARGNKLTGFNSVAYIRSL